jgi:hypothetical protein
MNELGPTGTIPLTENPIYIEFQKNLRNYGSIGYYGTPVDQASKYAFHTFERVLGNAENLPLGLETTVVENGKARVTRNGKRVTISTEVTEIKLKGKKTVKLVIDKKGGDYTAILKIDRRDVKFNGEIQTPLKEALSALVL